MSLADGNVGKRRFIKQKLRKNKERFTIVRNRLQILVVATLEVIFATTGAF